MSPSRHRPVESEPAAEVASATMWPSVHIAETLADEYGRGVAAHTPLPSERVMAERFGVQRPTVRVALEYLAQQGVIYRLERRGWFVSPPRLRYNPLTYPNIDRSRQHIEVFSTTPSGQPKAPQPGLRFFALRRYFYDGRLIVVDHLYLRPDMRRALDQEDLVSPVRDYLLKASQGCGIEITHDRLTVVAAAVGPDLAPVLEVSARQPILDITRVHYCGSEAVAAELEHWRSDVISLTMEGPGPGPA